MNTVENFELECPSCGELVTVFVDASVEHQEYVEDCPVCCSPMVLSAYCSDQGGISVSARSEDE